MSEDGLRLSLRSQVGLLAGLVLSLLVGGATAVLWRSAGEAFSTELGSSHARMALRLESLLEQQRQGGMMTLRSLGGALLSAAERESLGDALLQKVTIESGVDLEFEALALIDSTGNLLARSGGESFDGPSLQAESEADIALAGLAQRVARERNPRSILSCEAACLLLIAEPLLTENGDVVAIAGSKSIADWVAGFAALDDADLMVWKLGAGEATPRLLANSAEAALAERLAPVIFPLEEQEAPPLPMIIEASGKDTTYAVSRRVLPTDARGEHQVVLAVVQDITQQQKQLWLRQGGAVAAGILFLAMGVWAIGAVLRPALKRIRRLANALPMVAEGRFDEATGLLATSKHRWTDEIDILEGTARALIDRLSLLGSQVEERDLALRSKIEELDRRGAFVDRLLENAQLAIVVHDGVGAVLRTNGRGRDLLAQAGGTARFHALFTRDPRSWQGLQGKLLDALRHQDPAPIESETVIPTEQGDCHLQWLHCTVSGPQNEPVVLSIGLDLTRERRAMADLRWVADHDGLTGLLNRRSIHREIDRRVESGEDFSLFFIDLDGFGLVNKSDGHEVGNEVLQIVAKMLQCCFSERDLVARSGGDEFMAVIRDAQPASVVERAKALIRTLTTHVETRSGRSHEISCCVGISIFPLQGRTTSELLSHADAALLEAKRAGQGEWVWQADANRLIELSQHASRWRERLQDALASERFFLDFQPIVDLRTGETSHCECLIRLRLPDGSLANPAEFIGVAEEYGLIHRIDYWVINAAMNALRDLAVSKPDVGLAINVSGPTLQRADFVATVSRIIRDSGLVQPKLILELTETAALRDIKAAQSAMSELCRLGCQFALDDFGVGYSSFAYLRELPFSYVKLDGSYVRQALEDERNQSFIRAMVLLANGYQLKTVAEFVETAALQDFLREVGVHHGQGYHIARPAPLPLLEPRLLESAARGARQTGH